MAREAHLGARVEHNSEGLVELGTSPSREIFSPGSRGNRSSGHEMSGSAPPVDRSGSPGAGSESRPGRVMGPSHPAVAADKVSPAAKSRLFRQK